VRFDVQRIVAWGSGAAVLLVSPARAMHRSESNATSVPCRVDAGVLARAPLGYKGTLLVRNRHPVGPYSRSMLRLLWRSWGGGRFLMNEVPMYSGVCPDPSHPAPSLRWIPQMPSSLLPSYLQGCLTYKKTLFLRTLPVAYTWGPRKVLWGWAFSCGHPCRPIGACDPLWIINGLLTT
jgi:hypothetical protein